jgi:hypothetical protein
MPNRLLVAGIDFGTSLTKVVIRDNNTPGMHAIVVTNAHFPDGLIPSLIGISANGLSLPPAHAEGEPISYPKMLADHIAGGAPLADCPFAVPQLLHDHAARHGDRRLVRAVMALYFAGLMHTIENFIRGNDSPWQDFQFEPPNQSDILVFQMAVPTGMMDPIGSCEGLFREALVAAHRLRARPILSQGTVPVDDWCQLVDRALDMAAGELEHSYRWQCLVYPETAAAVQAYFRSPNANTGLFITMDVGGGTVDINAFRRQEHINDCDYYSSRVRPLGAENFTRRLNIRGTTGENQVMVQLRENVDAVYRLALIQQPNHGHEPGSQTWDNATLFIFGGGSNLPAYPRVFRDSLRSAGIHDPLILPLPGASDLDRPAPVDFGRFAVAYGMSFFKPNLDIVRLPHELKPFHDVYPRLREEPRPPYGFNWED